MQRKVAFFLVLICGTTLFAGDLFKVGVTSGYFIPSNDIFREVYDGDLVYGLKLGVHVWNGLYAYVSGLQYKKFSETTYTGDITRLTLNPIYLSLRYTAPLGKANPYVGGGYTYLKFKEESTIGDIEDSGNGYYLEAGIEFNLSSRFILDLNAGYNSVSITPFKEEIDLGGAFAGLSFLVVI
jgi:outer membrane protein W